MKPMVSRNAAGRACAVLLIGAAASTAHAQQGQRIIPPTPQAQAPAAMRPPLPAEAQVSPPRRSSGVLQGFSVVLVVGDLQGAGAPDDVPAAARKALADMRDFLPYKSYRLLDAAWLMCCGDQARGTPSERRPPSESSSLSLRGPDDQEYELRLSASRVENARVFVQFVLVGAGGPATAATAATTRTLQRRIADLEDKAGVLQKQIADARRRVEVGVSPGSDIPKLELELRSIQREMAELRDRVEPAAAPRAAGARGSADRLARTSVIDTSFTMDVGETVVVGASRPRGATKALIALVTAVPRTGAPAARD